MFGDIMKKTYSSSKITKYKTEKGNEVEIYKEKIGGKCFWFIGIVTDKKIYNVAKDFTNKTEATNYAKKLVKMKGF
jgi:hypothetical protein